MFYYIMEVYILFNFLYHIKEDEEHDDDNEENSLTL